MASGPGSPARTVASTNAPSLPARWRTSAAETGSSRWASSIPSTSRRPPARSRSASELRRISSSVSSERTSSGISPAKAPSGTAAALRVAWTHATGAPAASARAQASRASRDLPTPASAITTTPLTPASARAAPIASSSASRPISGQTADAVVARSCTARVYAARGSATLPTWT